MPQVASQSDRGVGASPPAPLVIAVEATRLATEVRGIGRYVRALVPRMLAQRPGSRIILFVKARHVESLAALYRDVGAPHGAVEVRPVSEMRNASADVFWYPWNVISNVPSRGPVVVTMHDVAPLVLPDPRLRKWRKNMRWRSRYQNAARRSTLLVVDSQFTADEVTRMLGVPPERMRVVLLAADDVVPSSPAEDASVLAGLGVEGPFILSVGAGDRRKNLALVERAMERIARSLPSLTLVLAGPRTFAQGIATQPERIKTVGFVTNEALMALYRSASCLVMPSKYEGFGLPVLEAMQIGLPVICARSSSLPEVGGDAVIWVDPDDDAEVADAITRIVSDPSLAARLRAAGRERAATFSWDHTARQTLEAFEEAVGLGATSPNRRWWHAFVRPLRSRARAAAHAASGGAERGEGKLIMDDPAG